MVRLCVQLGEHESFRNIIKERVELTDAELDSLDSNESLDEWIMRQVSTSQHISCTCKMGPSSDSMAVVDQYGKVYGLEGLRVADAYIMPDCIRTNGIGSLHGSYHTTIPPRSPSVRWLMQGLLMVRG